MSTKKILLIALLALVLSPIDVWCQQSDTDSGEVLTLDQAINIALSQNEQIKITQVEVDKFEDRIASVRTRRLPVFNLYTLVSMQVKALDFTFERGVFGTFPGIGPVPAKDVSIRTPRKPTAVIVSQVLQPLSQQYRIGLSIEEVKLAREAAKEKLRLERQTVVDKVKKAYYGILQTDSALESVQEAIKLYNELDRVTENFVLQHVSLKSDSLEVKTRLAKMQYEELNLSNILVTKKEQLNNLLGRDVFTEFRVNRVPEETAYEADLTMARKQALEERPEIREARLRIKKAEIDRRVKKSEYIPDVSFGFTYLSPRNFNDIVPKNFASVGIVLSWEVFDWGRKRHELAEKSKTIKQAESGLREAEDLVLIDVSDKFRKLKQTRQLLRVVQLGQETARENLRVNKNKYELQAALLSDVLQTEATLAETNHQYQQALLSFWTAKSELEKAMGGDK